MPTQFSREAGQLIAIQVLSGNLKKSEALKKHDLSEGTYKTRRKEVNEYLSTLSKEDREKYISSKIDEYNKVLANNPHSKGDKPRKQAKPKKRKQAKQDQSVEVLSPLEDIQGDSLSSFLPSTTSGDTEEKPLTSETRKTSETSMSYLVSRGMREVETEIQELQKQDISSLTHAKKRIDLLSQKIEQLTPLVFKPTDLQALAKTLESLVKLERDALLLPFGAVNPNRALAKPSESKHLHLHNHGMNGFIPE